jgi:glutamate dehydrogenase (NADP+)
MEAKTSRRGRLADLGAELGAEHHAEGKPWSVPCDVAFPCATQNELTQRDARCLSSDLEGLEMTQNAMHLTWSREDVDRRLREIMASIHTQCVEYGTGQGTVDYVKGANIAGFIKVADAMLAHGIV